MRYASRVRCVALHPTGRIDRDMRNVNVVFRGTTYFVN